MTKIWINHGGSDSKESACNVGDPGSNPGLGRSLEKEMATHSSNLAWRIPWTQKPGRLQSRGLQRVRYDWAITHATHTAQFLGFTVAVVVVAESCLTLCDPMDCSMRGFPVLHHLPKFAQTHVHWVDDAIQPSHALLPLLLLPSIFPRIRVFSNESTLCIGWPKHCSFSINISPSSELGILG